MWWVIFNIKYDFLSEWEEVSSPTFRIFLYTSPFQFFSRVELKLIVSSIRKCKHLAEMVIICNVIGCFMLALFYLENLMADFSIFSGFNIKCDFLSEVREGMPHPQCFPVHLLFIFLFLELNWNCVFCQKM